ncbi:acireductone synthase [Sphingomonas sp. FW199]|uniref:acireductone synthase n=1 Tax=Sphingomonas sp. FW199 TaxID=3400217 RepID=UPI003CF10C4B
MTKPKALLLDIEGTTSSIAFVAEVLFPYSRAHLRDWAAAHPDAAAPILNDVAAMEPGDPVDTLIGWMDEDRKATPLKTIQGMIWADGYADGTIRGHVYPDTIEALARWRAAGVPVHIYSSGSVEAQKLLFRHSEAGDLTPYLGEHFDTRVGAKREAASYAAIAAALRLAAGDVLFVSDMMPEVEAARAAGMQALLIDRTGDAGDVATLAEVRP